ncbi:MAG: hypothetical protein K0R66_1784, partial [Gammaproteobacteria bacterium]|nr:hypothetical protein [Gammaproteobacteria bacterium]
ITALGSVLAENELHIKEDWRDSDEFSMMTTALKEIDPRLLSSSTLADLSRLKVKLYPLIDWSETMVAGGSLDPSQQAPTSQVFSHSSMPDLVPISSQSQAGEGAAPAP